MASTLKEHPIWRNVAQALEQVNPQQIAVHHLQICHGEINGYWDEGDQFYETIRFVQIPTPELISSSLGVGQTKNSHWLQLKYSLVVSVADPTIANSTVETSLGELSLILDDSLEVIDENWVIDVNSPHVLAIR
jgi:hypothetical protein